MPFSARHLLVAADFALIGMDMSKVEKWWHDSLFHKVIGKEGLEMRFKIEGI